MEARVETALKMFEINLPGGGGAFTRALYANGRQQCKVEMRIVKVTRSAPGQDWVEVPLTTAERQSATLVSYSLNKKEALPEAWYCDNFKNGFNTGLWQKGLEDDVKSEQPEKEAGPEPFFSTIDLYLRCDSSRPVVAQRFMGKITVDGKVYTTKFSEGAQTFHSSVVVHPIKPYVLNGAALIRSDTEVYKSSGLTIRMYYWALPSGLSALEELALEGDITLSPAGQAGARVIYSAEPVEHVQASVLRFDEVRPKAVVRNVFRLNYPGAQNLEFDISRHPHKMRVACYLGAVPAQPPEQLIDTHWKIVDSFGCEHSFVLKLNNLSGDPVLE
jgi:hypothetical protein